MSAVEPEAIDIYRWADQLPGALWEDLAAQESVQAAQACGAGLEGGRYAMHLMGRNYLVDPAKRTVQEKERPDKRVSYQAAVVLVSTLARASQVLPAGNMVTPQELPGGSLFFSGPHEVRTRALAKRFGQQPQELLERAQALGGEPWDGADAAVRFWGLPRVPIYALVWGGDEEFSARAVVGIDPHAVHHLALDGILALTNLMISRLGAND